MGACDDVAATFMSRMEAGHIGQLSAFGERSLKAAVTVAHLVMTGVGENAT